MEPKERVITAINYKEPDRGPIVIGRSAQKFPEPVIKELLRHFGIFEATLKPVWAQFRFEYFSEPLWKRFEVDVRHVYWKPKKKIDSSIRKHGQSYVNEQGEELKEWNEDGGR